MDAQLKSNLTSPKHWVRLVYMVLFAFFLYIASFVMSVVVVVQFIFALFTGTDNPKLRAFGYSLTLYIQQALLFLSFNSEFKPFPFADWPDAPKEPVVAEDPAEPALRSGDIKEGVAEPNEPTVGEDTSAGRREDGGDSPDVDDARREDPKSKPPLVDPEAEKRILS